MHRTLIGVLKLLVVAKLIIELVNAVRHIIDKITMILIIIKLIIAIIQL